MKKTYELKDLHEAFFNGAEWALAYRGDAHGKPSKHRIELEAEIQYPNRKLRRVEWEWCGDLHTATCAVDMRGDIIPYKFVVSIGGVKSDNVYSYAEVMAWCAYPFAPKLSTQLFDLLENPYEPST